MAANDSQTAAVENEIAHLRGLDLDALRARWRSQTGRAAPSHLPKNLLLRVLAYRAQAAVFGDLDKATARLLDRIADEARSGKRVEVPVPDRVGLRPGTLLVREWEGVSHRVMVMAEGFAWNGVHLSEPLQGGPRDHRHALERPALLRPAGPEGFGPMIKPSPKALRCAIYTRVSTEHGLEQDFNSLDAQREAGRAYVKSQTHEGWRLVKESFDDGGFSGGSLERPALQRLLAAIRSRLIDVVVVYKVDRLTRSLADFAKLVEIFDAHGVSFVSVTQSFNTTTSMGRLTLNMLLSFAQFEREVTGERIRDKLAASKRRGIWVGGIVPLGYEVRERKLVVREDEAQTIRLIFERYLALGSLPALQRELRERGVVTRRRTPQLRPDHRRRAADQWAARPYPAEPGLPRRAEPQGRELSRRACCDRHACPVRCGPGEAHGQSQRSQGEACRLRRLFSSAASSTTAATAMTPSTAKKGSIRYRYYVSSMLAQGRRSEAGTIARVSAPEIEAVVVDALRAAYPDDAALEDRALIEAQDRAHRPAGRQHRHASDLRPSKPDRDRMVARHLRAADARSWQAEGSEGHDRGIKAEARTVLLRSIALGRRWLDEVLGGATIDEIADRERCTKRHVADTLPLAFLAPGLVRAVIEARLPRGISTRSIAEPELEWSRQWTTLGISARPASLA